MLEKASPTPLYYRIYTVLRERVTSGYYTQDTPIPSEASLAEAFSVSRITIRKAMELLVSEGLVDRARGRGTFVTETARKQQFNRPVITNINGLFSYLNVIGESTSLRVLSLEEGEAPPKIAVHMGIPPQTRLIRSTRIRSLEGSPYSLSIANILPQFGKGITKDSLSRRNMIDLVREAGADVSLVEQTLTAVVADDFAARHLEIQVGAPLMCVTRDFYDETAGLFYCARILYVAERYEYRVSLKRQTGDDFFLSDDQDLAQGLRRNTES